MDATDRDLQFAAQQTQLQDLDNRNDQQRQAIARTEEQAMEIRVAVKRLAESLKPDTQPVTFRTTP